MAELIAFPVFTDGRKSAAEKKGCPFMNRSIFGQPGIIQIISCQLPKPLKSSPSAAITWFFDWSLTFSRMASLKQ